MRALTNSLLEIVCAFSSCVRPDCLVRRYSAQSGCRAKHCNFVRYWSAPIWFALLSWGNDGAAKFAHRAAWISTALLNICNHPAQVVLNPFPRAGASLFSTPFSEVNAKGWVGQLTF